MRKVVLPAIVALAVAIGIFAISQGPAKNISTAPAANRNADVSQPERTLAWPATKTIAAPLANALSRVTKKPFGIYVTPKQSPVSPERFTGYHTGVDFETTADEQNVDVPIVAICAGQLLVKEWASGYGGVINEACVIDGQAVTVTYGHLKLSSIGKKIGESFVQGEKIGVLGKGYSPETDGERKHLHLGIHLGKTAKLSGYVATKAELKQWLNVLDYLNN